jgi:hypothetical protein
MSLPIEKAWNSVLADIKILHYQLDSLAVALSNCYKNATILYDRHAKEPQDVAEQLYADSYTIAFEIINVKMVRTIRTLEKNLAECMSYKDGKDIMISCRLEGLLKDIRAISEFSQQSLHFFSLPLNALNEKASEGLLAIASNFRIEKELIGSIIFL